MQMHEQVSATMYEIRSAARKTGQAAETQAELNIALTGVCVAALLVACLLVRSQRTEGAR